MALNFPSSPTNGQVYTLGGNSWVYNSTKTKWVKEQSISPLAVSAGGTGLATFGATPGVIVTDGSNNLSVLNYRSVAAAARKASNIVCNSEMFWSQENGNTGATTEGYYAADQWTMTRASLTGGPLQTQRFTSVALPNDGYYVSMYANGSAVTTGAAGYGILQQNIEGPLMHKYAWGTSSAKNIKVSFLAYCETAGTYYVNFANGLNNYFMWKPYTHGGTGWELHTITVPAPTAGTWYRDEGLTGLAVKFVVCAGSNWAGSSDGTWGGTNYLVGAATNPLTANGKELSFSGVIIYDADIPSPVDANDHSMSYPDNAADFLRCQRYFQKSATNYTCGLFWSGAATNTNTYWKGVVYPTEMCKTPVAIVFTNAGNSGFGTGTTLHEFSKWGFTVSRAATSTVTSGYFATAYTVSARL